MSKTERLQVLVSPALAARIEKAAQRARQSKGAWVRQAVERALKEKAGPADPVASLGALGAPTADIDQMLAELEAGRS